MKKLLSVLLDQMKALLTVSLAAAEEGTGSVRAGEIITFGQYPQTAEGTDQTPIDWFVLEVRDGKALVTSCYGLDSVRYNMEFEETTWETCSLRTWLNSDFLNAAFSPEEQKAIPLLDVDNSAAQGYSEWKTDGGNNTRDRVFLLSYAEANRYFGVTTENEDNIKARVAPTKYAADKGVWPNFGYRTEDGSCTGWWWLRSPGLNQNYAACVFNDGSLDSDVVNLKSACVRPALWINLEFEIFRSENLQYGSALQTEAEPFVFRNGIT